MSGNRFHQHFIAEMENYQREFVTVLVHKFLDVKMKNYFGETYPSLVFR
jgi:hypothetical protein